jgi:hypothetical protein
VGCFAFERFGAAFWAEIGVFSHFFAAVGTVSQLFSPLISMLDCKFKPLLPLKGRYCGKEKEE